MYRELDTEKWPRRATYELFRDYEDPFFNITANLSVDTLYRFCKEHGLSYSHTALFYSLEAANEIPEFRTRLKDGKLIEFDRIHATQTILNDDKTFSFCYFEYRADVFEFDKAGKLAVEKYKRLKTFDVESDRIDLIYYSVIPWISFTSFKHASRLDKSQTIPRIVFGKIFESPNGRQMPVSVELNHAVADGYHLGEFFERFQTKIDTLANRSEPPA